MEPTTFSKLFETGSSTKIKKGLQVKISSSWIVEGENRLSYTTIIRLIECCREFHWEKDIISHYEDKIDSICKSIRCDFKKPIFSGDVVRIEYSINDVRKKSYTLYFKIINQKEEICCEAWVTSVFYNPDFNQSYLPTSDLIDFLQNLKKEES